jgi:hypothetical protein
MELNGSHTAIHGLRLDLLINYLNRERVWLVQGLNAYRAVNTLRLGFKKPTS